MSTVRSVAIAALALTALSACGSASPAPSATPELTGSPVATASSASPSATPSAAPELIRDQAFTLYAGREEGLIAPLIEQFQEETGITVEVRYAGSTELAALLLEEGAATPADVFLSQDAGALGAVAKEGGFAVLPADVTSLVPEGLTSTDGSWVGVTGRARVIAYDSETVAAEDVPTTIAELTDPKWKGKVGIAPTNASFQSFITALRVLEGEDTAKQWLEDLIANDVKIYPKNGAIRDAVNSGEIQLGLINHYYWYELADEVGADAMRVQLSFPEVGDAGAIVNVSGAGLLAGAATDGDAQDFIAFLVSNEAQTYFVENTFEYPLIDGVEAPAGLPELGSLVNPELNLSDLDSLAVTTALLAEVGLL